MDFATFKKLVGFYGRFLVSFSAIGYRARALTWQALPGDFKGQTWIVTGATAGIGRAVVEGATRRGATVLALARSREKLDALVRSSSGPGRVIPLVVDLSLVRDTRRAAAEIVARGTPVDVLVNNVGLLLDDLSTTAEGFETSYATNLLTHWVLTEALLHGAALAPQATIIEMSSGGMYNAPLTLDYMNMQGARYRGVYAYAVHKRGQAELVKYWQARHGASGLRCYVMHPGWADTDGVKTAMPNFRRRLRSVLRDSAQGADTALWLAGTRPASAGPEAFWFDRAPRAAHAFPHTVKSKYTPDDLAMFLAKEAAKVDDDANAASSVGQALA
ncbi:MAG TPA: SDR family NAD(P)-dependent oxidoreductase [Steroidobacteraceae bacterium]|jgi:dehydrogenase/reductase SDR family protein 12